VGRKERSYCFVRSLWCGYCGVWLCLCLWCVCKLNWGVLFVVCCVVSICWSEVDWWSIANKERVEKEHLCHCWKTDVLCANSILVEQ